MPRGDREIFKADCEDGFTKIANLLLEALALARLNGVQKGICMFCSAALTAGTGPRMPSA